MKNQIIVKNQKINVVRVNNQEYISLTDLARYANAEDPSGVIRNWMSNSNSFEYYSLWEEINNENFNSVGLHRIKTHDVGYNRFTMTPNRWKRDFNAIGIIPSSGKYSKGTYAHPDIASARNQMEVLRNNSNIKELEILQKQANNNEYLIETK